MADTDPDELERRIERSRAELARTVDAIADRVNPKRVAQRGVARMRENAGVLLSTVSETVADMVGGTAGGTLGGAAGTASPAVPSTTFTGQPHDAWDERERTRRVAPVVIGVGAVLVVGAAVLLWRRRRR